MFLLGAAPGGGRGGGGGGGGGDRERSILDRLGPAPSTGGHGNPSGGHGNTYGSSGHGNTYGLSSQFLESLGIEGPLNTRVFVANVS